MAQCHRRNSNCNTSPNPRGHEERNPAELHAAHFRDDQYKRGRKAPLTSSWFLSLHSQSQVYRLLSEALPAGRWRNEPPYPPPEGSSRRTDREDGRSAKRRKREVKCVCVFLTLNWTCDLDSRLHCGVLRKKASRPAGARECTVRWDQNQMWRIQRDERKKTHRTRCGKTLQQRLQSWRGCDN